ncbi:hypothetical protein [Nonomuraea diastatica]|uniref:Uncharacterized protein n=1 Tax=Nonomuraea diastatica TaxID=1848329 RepID=A0A4R4WGX5_9ACTN|nr:hypothetical protein [Nonomuraea diastatica]TDD16607.1 hypothetical protein E1294_30720 [Nonomuraea diastatica]
MKFLSAAAAAETVSVDPMDIALLTCVLADHQHTAWTLDPDLAAALEYDGLVVVQALQLWLLLGAADPELVYGLDGAEDATHERMDVHVHHRLKAALYAQAPLTAAAMNALADAEFILRNVGDLGSP